jgi:hypothetical protein
VGGCLPAVSQVIWWCWTWQKRDRYFYLLKLEFEKMLELHKQKSVVMAHSYGTIHSRYWCTPSDLVLHTNSRINTG